MAVAGAQKGAVSRNADIAGHGQRHTRSRRRARQCCNGRLRHVPDRAGQAALTPFQVFDALVLGHGGGAVCAHALHIPTSTKGRARAGQDDGTDAVVGATFFDLLADEGRDLVAHGVAHFRTI